MFEVTERAKTMIKDIMRTHQKPFTIRIIEQKA